MPEILDNPKSARVKRAAALARKKDRLATGRFLVEGPQSVRELLTHRPEQIDTLYATIGAEPWQREIDALASERGVSIDRVTEAVLSAVAETVHPQGVVAVARIERVELEEALAGARLVAVLNAVRDPGNAGTVIRAADAAGADAVIFTGQSIDPWHPKVVRATTGSLFHLPVVVEPSLGMTADALRAQRLTVLAADVGGEELAAEAPELRGGVAWVFGNEASGLTDAERDVCDAVLRLPIYGAAESLNLATAASVCLYTTAFAQRSARAS